MLSTFVSVPFYPPAVNRLNTTKVQTLNLRRAQIMRIFVKGKHCLDTENINNLVYFSRLTCILTIRISFLLLFVQHYVPHTKLIYNVEFLVYKSFLLLCLSVFSPNLRNR